MDKLKWKLQDFFRGRNGVDELGRMIGIASIVCYILGLLFRSNLIYTIGMVGVIYFLYRMLSRKISDRRAENKKFTDYIKLNKMRYEQRKEFRIFKCKSCGRSVRVPKGKGKIEVTCPVCGHKEVHRS